MAENELNDFWENETNEKSVTSSIRGENYDEWVFKNKTSIILALTGGVLIGLGFFLYRSGVINTTNNIEIIDDGTGKENNDNLVYAEASGALNNPGVYKMKDGDRVEDLLIRAGGLSIEADGEWVVKNINRAAKLVDGQKIYIPKMNERSLNTSAKDVSLDIKNTENTYNTQTDKININTASLEELESLWGIGPVTGKNIIDHRPYSDISELKFNGILKSNVYDANKDKLSVY